jgi:hypothetical protein
MQKIYILALLTSVVLANEADVLNVKVKCDLQRSCNFSVTIKHNDTGWKHYVNRYEILSPTGKVLGTRVLFHPHVNEQPFTRSISNVKIPAGIKSVIIRAHDLVHKYGGKEFEVKLPTL